MKIKYFIDIIQNKRDNQEDALIVDEGRSIFAVVDGMGGHKNGELVSEDFVLAIKNGGELKDAFWDANQKALDREDNSGAVAVGLELCNYMTIHHCGDARAYHLTSKQCKQVTTDEERDFYITNGIGFLRAVSQINIPFPTKESEAILLTTDGIHDRLTAGEIHDIVMRALHAKENPITALIAQALENGAQDNCTGILITVEPTDGV
jgi:serine/threonine protein phosphatase PrpC